MKFIILIFATAFLMEAIGSYISVVGLSDFFSGDKVILLMGVILDIAKLVSVSFLYQSWDKLTRFMRYYMTTAVVVLMLITSSGAFGYLSAAFQQALQPNKELAVQVDSVKRELAILQPEKQSLTASKERIDVQIANLPNESVRGRQRLMASFKPEQDRINSRMQVIDKRVAELTTQQLTLETDTLKRNVHTGPITYVAETFGVTQEQASKYVILLIIFVFDPLAVMLVIAGNFLLMHKELQPKEPVKTIEEVKSAPPLTPDWPEIDDAQREDLATVGDPVPLLEKIALKAIRRPTQPEPQRGPKVKGVSYKLQDEPILFEPDNEIPIEEVDFSTPTFTDVSIPEVDVFIDQPTPIQASELIPEKPMLHSMLDDINLGLDSALFSSRNRESKAVASYR